MTQEISLRSAGDGPDAVFLHGFGSDRLSWLATIPSLKSVRTHAFDLPGHGKSLPALDKGTPQALASQLIGAVEAMGLTSAYFVGHSLGAGLSLLIAQKRPDLVRGLFLIAPVGLGKGVDTDFMDAYPRMNDPEEARDLLYRLVDRPQLISDQMVQHALAQLREPGMRSGLKRVASALIANEQAIADAASDVSALGIRRHVVWGENDRINPPDPARLSTFASYELIPGTGHLPHIERPREINKRLTEAIAQSTP